MGAVEGEVTNGQPQRRRLALRRTIGTLARVGKKGIHGKLCPAVFESTLCFSLFHVQYLAWYGRTGGGGGGIGKWWLHIYTHETYALRIGILLCVACYIYHPTGAAVRT